MGSVCKECVARIMCSAVRSVMCNVGITCIADVAAIACIAYVVAIACLVDMAVIVSVADVVAVACVVGMEGKMEHSVEAEEQ
ncbi:hypothetical protein R1flu_025019 [Riccia fluitans]|uniref:Uncharacterized protein n=1 Tax=Riccia fluitans TaxID=41844 RepID=A0ABD1XWJ8_9MARC